MKLSFLSTHKRINSFEQPDPARAESTSVFEYTFIKQTDVSMTTPEFYIAAANFPEVNYCVLENFASSQGTGHIYRPSKIYYWITDIISDHNNRWYIKCKIDLLATWKTQILNQQAFVEFSSSNYDTDIIDARYPTKEDPVDYQSYGFSVAAAGGAGTYVLGVLNKENYGGMTTYYAMTESQFGEFKTWLNSDNILTELYQKYGGVDKCIKTCLYFPISYSDMPVVAQGSWIQIGNSNCTMSSQVGRLGSRPTISNASGSNTVTVLHAYSDYRKSFELHDLYLPYVGVIPINGRDLYDSSSIRVLYGIDCITGEIQYRVQKETGKTTIGTYAGQVGIPIAVNELQSFDAVSAVKSLITAAGMAVIATVASGPMAIGAAVGGATAGVNTMVSGVTTTATQIGSNGGLLAPIMGMQVQLMTRGYGTPELPTNRVSIDGGMCFKTLTLNTLTGYCKTKNFHTQNSGYMTLIEQREVERMFNEEGVYI